MARLATPIPPPLTLPPPSSKPPDLPPSGGPGLRPEPPRHTTRQELPEEPRDPFHKSINADEIGTGKLFTAGEETTWRKKGLWGSLRNLKGRYKTTSANLSWKDLRKMHGLLADELKKRPVFPSDHRALSRRARARILKQGKKLVKAGGLSRADFDDLKKTADVLHEKKNNKTI